MAHSFPGGQAGELEHVKLRYLRGGDALGDDEDVVVRGGELDPAVLQQDTRRNHEIYGVYGISVFAVRGMTLDEMAQQAPLVRFGRLTLVKAGVIQLPGGDWSRRAVTLVILTSPSTSSTRVSTASAGASTRLSSSRTMKNEPQEVTWTRKSTC